MAVKNRMVVLNFLLILSSCLFSSDIIIDFVNLKGAKRDNRGAGYWEIGWGRKSSEVGNTGEEVVGIGPFNYINAGERQEIGELYLYFPEKDTYTLAVDVRSSVKGIYKLEIVDGKGNVVAESAVMVKGKGVYNAPLIIESPTQDIKMKLFFSGDSSLDNITFYIYKSFLDLYPVKDKYPLLGVYYRKFGANGFFSDIFEEKVVDGKVQEFNNMFKEGIDSALVEEDYKKLMVTKLGKTFGIEIPSFGEEDVWVIQRIYGKYCRLFLADTGEYKERWIGQDNRWSVISEIISSAVFDTDRDGIWNGQRPYDWVNGERLLDNYGKDFYLDYVLFIPAMFFEVEVGENTSGKLSFIYITKNSEDKEITLPLIPEDIMGGKVKIGFINAGRGIQIIQKGVDRNKILATITDSIQPWCLSVKPASIKIEMSY
ncbi:MAG: hypothetical protein N3D17_07250 [bacterium]|nr:hypothetical protein [bacterium]